jgi:hypothetical protein
MKAVVLETLGLAESTSGVLTLLRTMAHDLANDFA